jgi:hypothetical protein
MSQKRTRAEFSALLLLKNMNGVRFNRTITNKIGMGAKCKTRRGLKPQEAFPFLSHGSILLSALTNSIDKKKISQTIEKKDSIFLHRSLCVA